MSTLTDTPSRVESVFGAHKRMQVNEATRMQIGNIRTEHAQFVAFDLETTGISSFADRVVDIGAVRFCLSTAGIDTFEQIVDPQRDIPPVVTAIHGIRDEDVAGRPTIDEVLPAFEDFIGDEDTVLIAHNAPFDCSFLAAAYTASHRKPPTNHIICSLRLFRLAFPQFENYKLETIGRELGLISREEHRGLADSLLLMRCLSMAFELLPQFPYLDSLFQGANVYRFTDYSSTDITLPTEFEGVQLAIEGGSTLEIRYGEFPGPPRVITPKQIFRQNNAYYVKAYCHVDSFEKTFRLDRIVSFTVVQSSS
ncbi:MAG: WYL domain-containing protein [Planctomycetaceae bacterium]|jgi:DNA polymerase III subunit epsilon|nr:WYL domain-containing protein [Planctomycetaceae bacterium]